MADVVLKPVDFDPFKQGNELRPAGFPAEAPAEGQAAAGRSLDILKQEQLERPDDVALKREITRTERLAGGERPPAAPGNRGAQISTERRRPKPVFPLDGEQQPAVTLKPVDHDPFAAQPAGPSNVVDVGHNLKIGADIAAQDTRELVSRVPGIGPSIVAALDKVDEYFTGKPSGELLKSDIESQTKATSPAQQAAGQKRWDTLDQDSAWRDWRSYTGGVAQSLPEQAITMFPAMRLAKGAYAASIAKGLAPEVAGQAAARTATVAGGALEGALGGAQSSRQVRDDILALKPDELQDSEALKSLMATGLDFDAARAQLADDSATKAFFLAGVATGIFGGMGDRVLAKAMTGQLAGGAVKRAVKGAVAEGALEELPQSALQQASQNVAMQGAQPETPIGKDVANQALGGLAVGAVQGGAQTAAFGHAGAAAAPAAADQPAAPVPGAEAAPTQPAAAPPLSPIDQARADAQVLKSGGDIPDADETRMKNATLVSVYGENAAVRHVIDSPQQFASIGDAMLMAAPTVERVRGTIQHGQESRDITPDILGAIEEIGRIRTEGKTVAQVMAHGVGHEISFEGQQLAQFLDENSENPKRIAAFIENYLQEVENATGVPSQVRGRAFDIVAEQQAARKKADEDKAAAQVKVAEKADADKLKKVRHEVGMIRAETALADLRAKASKPEGQTAMEAAFEKAKLLKGKSSEKPRPASPVSVPARKTENPAPGTAKGAGPAARGASALPKPAQADHGGNARPVREGGNRQGAGEVSVNRGAQIAGELAKGDGSRENPVIVSRPKHITAAAARAAEQPSAAQKNADNYAKGHFKFAESNPLSKLGVISIETAKGKERVAKDGSWSVPNMPAHYGHLQIAEGADGDKADISIGDDLNAKSVYVIDQIDPETKKFDETKSMAGFSSQKAAEAVYAKSFTDGQGRARIGAVTEMTPAQYVARAQSNGLKEAVAYQNPEASAPARRKGSQFLQAIRTAGGIDPKFAAEVGGDTAVQLNRRLPGLMRKGGMSEDGLLEWAQQNGYLNDAQIAEADRNVTGGGAELAKQLIRRALNDEDVHSADSAEAAYAREADESARNDQAYHEYKMATDPQYLAAQTAIIEPVVADLASEMVGDWSTMTEEQKDAELDSIFGADSRKSPVASATEAGKGTPAAATRPSLELQGQTPAEVASQHAQAAAQAAQAAAESVKAAVDEMRGAFALTGSKRAADAARGQQDLLAEVPSKIVAETEDITGDFGATLDHVLSPAEKSEAARALGDSAWSAKTADKFLSGYADWLQQGAKDLGTALSRIFSKVLAAVRNGSLAIAVAINFNLAEVAKPLPVAVTKTTVQISLERPRANFNGVEASADARLIADWFVRNQKQEGDPFIIADKPGGFLYAFDSSGALLAKSPAIFGKARGDTLTEAQAAKSVDESTDADKVTPAGIFKARPSEAYGAPSVVLKEFTDSQISIHSVYLGTPSEQRMERLQSDNPDSKRISYGCINALPEFIDKVIAPNFSGASQVIVVPETMDVASYFGITDKQTIDQKVTVTSTQHAEAVSWGDDKYGREERQRPGARGTRRRKGLSTQKGGALSVEPEPIEGASSSPTRPPNDRWYSDPGAMPGEPMLFLDVTGDDLDTAKAAIVEREVPGKGVLYDAMDRTGNLLGIGQTAEEAAAIAERRLDAAPAFSRQADNIEDYKLQQKPARSGQPLFWNKDIGLGLARPEFTSGLAEGERTVGYGIYDAKARDAEGKAVKLGTLRVDLDARGKFSALRLIEIRKEFRQNGLGWGETTIASLLQHNGATPMRIIDIQHHTGDDWDALPFWQKMGTRLDNYATDPNVQIDGTLTLKDYLRARAEKGKFSRDARPLEAAQNLAQGAQPGGASEGAPGAQGREQAPQQPDAGGAERGPGGRAGTPGRNAGVVFTPESIRREIGPILRSWGNSPQVVVLGSMAEAPEAVRTFDEGQRSQGATGSPSAFFWGGKAYLVANEFRSIDAAKTALFHEVLGHAGLRGAFGDKLNPILDRVAFDFKDRVAAKAADYGLDVKKEDERRQAAEEVLAELAQTRPQHSLVRRLIAAIRQFLRDVGLDLKLSDADLIANYIAPARGFVERGRAREALQTAPAFSRVAAALPSSTFSSARSVLNAATRSDRTLNRLISKFNTPFHIAETHPEFKPVYEEAQDYNQDVSRVANETADLAPDLLPRIESFSDFKKSAPSNDTIAGTANALYAGTLWGGGSPLEGRVFSDEELRSGKAITNGIGIHAFDPMNDEQIKLYRQALASVGHSLTEHAKSLVWRLAKQKGMRLSQQQSLSFMATVADQLAETQTEGKRDRMRGADDETRAAAQREIDEIDAFRKAIKDIQDKTEALIAHGYFPAMRFGPYAVNVQSRTLDGKWKEEYFGRFETQTAANLAKEELRNEYPNAQVTSGVMNEDAHKLFQGLNLDALELFSQHMRDDEGKPISADPIMQEYFRVATTERSSLKRQIHRKGTAGFSRDVPRALAQFTVSNATAASRNYHAADMLQKVQKIKAGDLQAYATRYVRYLQDPQEESPALRGFLANYYILGSIAFGAVNMTQPILMTAPYLTQHTSWANAMKQLGRAAKDLVTGRKDLTPQEQAAYAKAAKAGIVSPQEIHQIRAESRASMMGDSPLWQKLEAILAAKGVKLPGKLLMRKAAFVWGSIYSMTEQFNRGTTFLAAYRVSHANGDGDPYTFAKNAVDATQGVYARSNRPEVSRGAVGATLMTFKQFNISYLELAKRLYDTDKKAFAVLMLTLMSLAGAEGLPFAEDVEDLIDTIGQWMGYPTNAKKALRKQFVEMLGPDIADVMLHGASAIPGVPIDVANRMGMHNIIPGSALLKTSEPDKTRDIVDLLGPAAGLFKNVGNAVEGVATGKPSETKLLLPSALQNAFKASEMVDTGTYRDMQGRKVMDVDVVDAFAKMIGFQPAKVARETRLVSQNQQDIALHKVIEDSIAGKWAHGIADKDPGAVSDALKQWADWNKTNPEMPIAITGGQIQRRIKEIAMSREQRFIKSAPKEIRNSVRQDMLP